MSVWMHDLKDLRSKFNSMSAYDGTPKHPLIWLYTNFIISNGTLSWSHDTYGLRYALWYCALDDFKKPFSSETA